MNHLFRPLVLLGLLVTFPDLALSAEEPVTYCELPSEETAWINSSPLSVENLKGKAVILWFFEEECPKCRANWPNMYKIAEKYAEKPVIFVAVNSGTPRKKLEKYVQEVGLKWPVIVDTSREFEKECDLYPLNLNNITHIGFITTQGQYYRGDWRVIDQMVERALADAYWSIKPAEVPDAVRVIWRAFEFGDAEKTADLLKRAKVHQRQDVREGAVKFETLVKAAMNKELDEAKSLKQGGPKVWAFKAYHYLLSKYRGFDIPAVVQETCQELLVNAEVQNEFKSMRDLHEIEDQLPVDWEQTPAKVRTSVVEQIHKWMETYPRSDSQRRAKTILREMGGDVPK
jgi:thiol-disulfide isomerase/thioredoxin